MQLCVLCENAKTLGTFWIICFIAYRILQSSTLVASTTHSPGSQQCGGRYEQQLQQREKNSLNTLRFKKEVLSKVNNSNQVVT